MLKADTEKLRRASPDVSKFLAFERELEESIRQEEAGRRAEQEEEKRQQEKKARKKRLKRLRQQR